MTGVDKWTNKSTGQHKQIGKGFIRSRGEIIEARYKLKDIGIELDQALLINAWDDSSGTSYDNTSQSKIVWTNHSQVFTVKGKIRGIRIDERSLSPMLLSPPDEGILKISLYNKNSEKIGIEFKPGKIKVGYHRIKERDYAFNVFSPIIQKAEGYSGNLVSGKLNIFENNDDWITGYYNFTSNANDTISGFFSVKKR